MRASRAGVVVVSCSDPRLNPYQILGLDSTLSKHTFELKSDPKVLMMFFQKLQWLEMQEVELSMLFELWLFFKQLELQELLL